MKRTPFMALMMLVTADYIAFEALTGGGFTGAWERLIARKLQEKKAQGHSEAEVLLESTGGDALKAAYLITSSKIESYDQVG